MQRALPPEMLLSIDARSDESERIGAMAGNTLAARMSGSGDTHLCCKVCVCVNLHPVAAEPRDQLDPAREVLRIRFRIQSDAAEDCERIVRIEPARGD